MHISFRDIRVFGLYPSSLLLKTQQKIVKNSKNTTFRKLDLFPSSGEGKPTLLGPLDRASLSHRTIDVTDHTSYKHLRPG
jgi:hypothetical protein